MKESKLKKLTATAMMMAIAYVCVLLIRIPLIPAAPFLTYEPKDSILALTGMLFGPIPAIVSTVCVALLEMITISGTGPIGALMNVLSTLLFLLPVTLIYRRKRSLAAVLIGLLIGMALMVGGMLLWNYLVTPLYMGIPRDTVAAMLLPVFLPFNLIKSGLNATLAVILFIVLVPALSRAGLMPPRSEKAESTGARIAVAVAAVIVLAALIATVVMMPR